MNSIFSLTTWSILDISALLWDFFKKMCKQPSLQTVNV